jgi:restriction system protein
MGSGQFTQSDGRETFVGREKELAWLRRETDNTEFPYRNKTIFVVGTGGIGKTALVQRFLEQSKSLTTTKWLDLYSIQPPDHLPVVESFTASLYAERARSGLSVVIDGGELLSDEQLQLTLNKIWNFKAVQWVIITTRRFPSFAGASVLGLDALNADDSRKLLASLMSLSHENVDAVLRATQGHPLAMNLIAGLSRTLTDDQLLNIVRGEIYDLKNVPITNESKIITVVQPVIISANEAILEALKKQPQDIYKLSPRKYEEIVAELLSDRGFDVELTKATRDGGKDILAYLKTVCGTFLCLVEAKRYRSDRIVGVELVRTLYGTLCDYQANSAMMVTTSSFSKDAHEFQRKHEYQLSLRDYADLTRWIQEYGKRK